MGYAYVPSIFLRNLAELVADEEAMPLAEVLRKTGLTAPMLLDENTHATLEQQAAIYECVAELSSIPGIGFRSPSAHSFADQGVLGALMIMAPTVGEALKKLSEFIDVIGGAVEYKIRQSENLYILSTKDKTSYSPAAHQLIAEENLAIWKFSSLPVPGLEAHLDEIRLDYPKPKNWRMYTDLFPNCRFSFGRSEIAAVLSSKIIDLAIPTHNPEAFKKLESASTEILSRINSSLKLRIIDCLERSHPTRWSASAIADELGMTAKTISRHLKREGASIKSVIEIQKKTFAMRLMEKGSSDTEIATALGYAGKSSFARGFKTWTGKTPAHYRKSKQP